MTNVTASALTSHNTRMQNQSGAIGASDALGFNQFDTVMTANISGRNATTSMGGVNTVVRNTLYNAPTITQTGNNTDLAIDGDALFAVKDDAGNICYTRVGNFRMTEDGTWKNSSNCTALGWKLDKSGNLPQNATQITGLSPVNLNGIGSSAQASTRINLGITLNSEQATLKGPGVVAQFTAQGINSTTGETGIITPDSSTWGSLQFGDQFLITPQGFNAPLAFTYGGVASTSAPSATNRIAGVSNVNDTFAFVPAHAGGGVLDVVKGDKITISSGSGESLTLTFGDASATNVTFNSLQTFATAINNNSYSMTARVANGRVYITNKDANNSITFTDVGGSLLKEVLGLSNVSQAGGGTTRFATLEDLRQKIKTASPELEADVLGSGINFYSASALNPVTVSCATTGVVEAYDAWIGMTYIQNSTPATSQRTIVIEAHDNNLRTGDFVRITGLQAVAAAGITAGNGIYMVTASNKDSFSICAQGNSNPIGALNATTGAAPFTWQKIPGRVGNSVNIDATYTATTTAASTLQIHGGAAINAGYGRAPLAVNDIVYISGGGSGVLANNLPAGYYIVSTAVAANDITLSAVNAGLPGGAALGAAGAAVANAFTIQKIGEVAVGAAATAIDSMPISTGAAAADTLSTVTVYMSNNYSPGEVVQLNMPADVVFDGIDFKAGALYKVTNVTPGGALGDPNTAFQVQIVAGPGGAAGAELGFLGNHPNASVYTVGAGNPGIGGAVDTYINSMSSFFHEFSVDPVSSKLVDMNAIPPVITELAKTYDPSNPLLNMAGGLMKSGNAYYVDTQVYDSLGTLHTLRVGFAKLTDLQWAVEIYGIKDSNGDFDVVMPNKQLASGNITFDGNGNLLSVDPSLPQANSPLSLTWKNGANPSSVLFNWGGLLDLDGNKSNQGVLMTDAPYDIRTPPHGDGFAAGVLISTEVTEDGYVVAHFSNSMSQKVFQMPVITFANLNGLDVMSGGIYRATTESGEPLLKVPGRNNIAIITSGALSGSNVDTTESILDLMGTSQVYQMISNVISKEEQALQSLLRATAG